MAVPPPLLAISRVRLSQVRGAKSEYISVSHTAATATAGGKPGREGCYEYQTRLLPVPEQLSLSDISIRKVKRTHRPTPVNTFTRPITRDDVTPTPLGQGETITPKSQHNFKWQKGGRDFSLFTTVIVVVYSGGGGGSGGGFAISTAAAGSGGSGSGSRRRRR